MAVCLTLPPVCLETGETDFAKTAGGRGVFTQLGWVGLTDTLAGTGWDTDVDGEYGAESVCLALHVANRGSS